MRRLINKKMHVFAYTSRCWVHQDSWGLRPLPHASKHGGNI